MTLSTLRPHTPSARTEAERKAIRFLAGYLRTLIHLAGEDFAWVKDGKPVGHEPSRYSKTRNESARQGYRIILWTRQGGLCASCGEAVDFDSFDIAHLVGNGGSKGKAYGHVDFNTFACCTFCNLLDAEDHEAIIPPAALARPDLLGLMPTRRDMLAADKAMRDETTQRKARLRAERARRLASWQG